MKHLLAGGLVILFCILIPLTGCKRPASVAIKENTKETGDRDIWTKFATTVRYPDTPRDNDDWSRFRDGLGIVTAHFAKPEVVERTRLASDDRKFLERELGVTATELSDIESSSFRPADAFYLDECFLLRDVARKLEISEASTKDHIVGNFHWVMRNVLPIEQGDTSTPPAYALRRGWGSALERAVVLLALLRQSRTEGCLIVLPESAPLRFLVAARDGDDLLLFDTRLGLPVMTAAGKDVATLKQALQEPGLLKPSQFTQDDAKKLEAWLVCPLHALAPRMLELQKHIADPIVLHLDARKLQQDFAKITSIPVKTWSTNVEIATAGEAVRKTVTPARWLREFIPRQDGGVDETGRAAQWIRSRIPMQTAIANYDRIGLRQKTVPTPVALKLLEVTGILFGNYELTARELYLRGMHTPLQNRQQRLQKFVSDERLAGLVGNPEFDKERIEWVSKINAAYAEILSNPKMADRAAQAVQGYFMQDQLAAWLIDVNRELPLQEREPADAKKHDPKAEKPMLSRILAVGTREFFERELARATAQKSHENAELEQARLRAQAKPSAAARKDALDAWEQAKTGWANFYLDAFLLSTRVDEQIQRLRQEPLDGPKRLEMLETLHRDIHKHFQARLCLAECKQHLDGPAASCAYLEATRKELDTFDKDERLRDEIAKLKKDATDLPTQHPMRASIALLERDASATGAAFWLKQHIDQRIAALGKEPRTE